MVARTEDHPTRVHALRLVLFLLGGTSVASLLAWVFGLGSFRLWFLTVSVPGQLLLAALGIWIARRDDLASLRLLVVAGAVGGLVGTFGYDLFRVPFVMLGLRVLAPIDSYGVLASGASASSAWTGLLGWTYHFANGIGFGIAYAMLAPRRHWRWGVAWALLLETATVVTPFATAYALRGGANGTNWRAIAIAYAAHVPFGYALGRAVQDPEATVDTVRAGGRFGVPVLLGTVLVGLVAWQAPWRSSLAAEGADLADGASALIVEGEFEPEWLRVPVDGCVLFENRDGATWTITVAGEPVDLPPGPTEVCFPDAGVHRTRTSDEPYAGGFVIVDEDY